MHVLSNLSEAFKNIKYLALFISIVFIIWSFDWLVKNGPQLKWCIIINLDYTFSYSVQLNWNVIFYWSVFSVSFN